MNKKAYIAPVLRMVSITHHVHILSASPGIGTSEGPARKDGEVLSRRNDSFWDDEE